MRERYSGATSRVILEKLAKCRFTVQQICFNGGNRHTKAMVKTQTELVV